MWRIIRPDNGYCLFFPERKAGSRFEAGRRVKVWAWEEWKHIKLGQFEVSLPHKKDQELVTTSENLECAVAAAFQIVVGGPEEGRESRLEKCTVTCPASRDNRAKIELVFFQEWATNYCRTSVARVLNDSSYIQLIESADYHAATKKRIEEDLKSSLASIGLIYIRSEIVIKPLEPRRTGISREIQQKWLEFFREQSDNELQMRLEQDRMELERAEQDRQKARRMTEIEEGRRAEQKAIECDFRDRILEIEAQSAIRGKEKERDKDREIAKIQEEIDTRAQNVQIQTIQWRSALDLEEQRMAEEQEKLRRLYEEEKLQYNLQRLEKERQVKQRELELSEIRQRVAAMEREDERLLGIVRAEVTEREALARAADRIKMRELLLTALPDVVEQANKPLEKMGQIRALSLNTNGSPGQDGSLGSLLASASTLPVLKEFLRFLRDWEAESNDLEGLGADRPTRAG